MRYVHGGSGDGGGPGEVGGRRHRLLLLLLALFLCCAGAALLFRLDPTGGAAGRAPPREDSTADAGTGSPGVGGGGSGSDAASDGAEADRGGAESDEAGKDAAEGGEEEEFSFEDETPYSVKVRVFDPSGDPAEGDVEIIYYKYAWKMGLLPKAEEGGFRGHLPEPGRYLAEADWEGTRRRVSFEVTEDAPEAPLEIRFEGRGSVSGSVLASSGIPDEGVRGEGRLFLQADLAVELLPDAEPGKEIVPLLSARVDDRGRYRIAGVPAGTWIVRVPNKFHASVVTVGEGAHVIHDIRLGGGRIFGRVTDRETGKPLEYAQVIIKLADASAAVGDLARRAGFSLVNDRLQPDGNGDYEFRHLPFGDYRMLSSGKGCALQPGAVSVTESAPDARHDFLLERGSSVILSVTDLDGDPVEIPRWSTRPGVFTGYVGHIGGLRTGTYDFVTLGIGYEIQFRKDVVFRPGEPTELEFRLASEVPTTLEFVDPEGVPVEGVRVSVFRHGRDIVPYLENLLRGYDLTLRTTGPAGYVDLRAVPEGPVRVVARKSGYARFDETIALGKGRKTIRVELEPAETEFAWRVRITGVNPGTAADRIGLRTGDAILIYDGTAIDSRAALGDAIFAARERGADRVTMTVLRAGERFDVEAVPGPLGVKLDELEAE